MTKNAAEQNGSTTMSRHTMVQNTGQPLIESPGAFQLPEHGLPNRL